MGEGFIDDDPQRAYLLGSVIWDSTGIPVCWENPGTDDAADRAAVESAVRDTWEAAAPIDFYGWGACGEDSPGIRIRIANDHPHVKELGDRLDGKRDGMVLNFFREPGDNFLTCRDDEAGRQRCIRLIAVHEFGHALGFAHEQNRPDTPDWCDDSQGTDGDILVGEWDESSVMNYCNERWNNEGQLSDGDIRAAQLAYGASAVRGVQLANREGNSCLDVSDVSQQDGANVHGWGCHGNANQLWDLVPIGGHQYQIVSRNSLKCLDVAAWSADDGGNLQQWTCSKNDNQLFEIVPQGSEGFMLVSKYSGKCVDLNYGDGSDGTNIHQWWCHGGANQAWSLK